MHALPISINWCCSVGPINRRRDRLSRTSFVNFPTYFRRQWLRYPHVRMQFSTICSSRKMKWSSFLTNGTHLFCFLITKNNRRITNWTLFSVLWVRWFHCTSYSSVFFDKGWQIFGEAFIAYRVSFLKNILRAVLVATPEVVHRKSWRTRVRCASAY